MKTRIIIIAVYFLLLNLACDEKKPITQELCERQTNRAECEAAGCTYTCGMVFKKSLVGASSFDCVARRRVGRCLAVVKKVVGNINNDNDVYTGVGANSIGWIRSGSVYSTQDNHSYHSYFLLINTRPYSVEVLGYESPTWPVDSADQDPCTQEDPYETLFPWEGSCETDWWSEAMWDDVLAE